MTTARALLPRIVARTGLVPLAAAREVVDEVAPWLGRPLPAGWARTLAVRAHVAYAQSPSFRRALSRPGDAARDRLYVFLRHWLAARIHAEAPGLSRRLPPDYAAGAEPPPPPAPRPTSARPNPQSEIRPPQFPAPLSPEARQLAPWT